eukprot:487635-Rhodomonas_salina.1
MTCKGLYLELGSLVLCGCREMPHRPSSRKVVEKTPPPPRLLNARQVWVHTLSIRKVQSGSSFQ